jgi:hypothetical protein
VIAKYLEKPVAIKKIDPGYQFSAIKWDKGEKIRLYSQRLSGAVVPYSSTDYGVTWTEGSPIQ